MVAHLAAVDYKIEKKICNSGSIPGILPKYCTLSKNPGTEYGTPGIKMSIKNNKKNCVLASSYHCLCCTPRIYTAHCPSPQYTYSDVGLPKLMVCGVQRRYVYPYRSIGIRHPPSSSIETTFPCLYNSSVCCILQ